MLKLTRLQKMSQRCAFERAHGWVNEGTGERRGEDEMRAMKKRGLSVGRENDRRREAGRVAGMGRRDSHTHSLQPFPLCFLSAKEEWKEGGENGKRKEIEGATRCLTQGEGERRRR